MSSLFQPQTAQVNSAVTPQAGVPDAGAQLFTDVLQVATEATLSYTGQQELTDLSAKFDKVSQARQQGGDRTKLQINARAALDEAKANAPWISKEADKLFNDTFGGGSSGLFEKTPEEKAQEAHAQNVEQVRLARGLPSAEEAQKRITLEENAKAAKTLADAQKDVREYNGEVVFANTQAQTTEKSIKFMDMVNIQMTQSGGTLSNDQVRNIEMATSQEALRMRQELNSQVRDPQTGHLLVSKETYDSNLANIDEWEENTKNMTKDQSFLKVIQELNTEQNAQIQFLATQKYPTLKELNAAGGQASVQAYLTAVQQNPGVAQELLKRVNPVAADMFKQEGSFLQSSSTGFDKIILPTPTGDLTSQKMTEPEAYAVGTLMNVPENYVLALEVVDNVGSGQGSESYGSMIQKNPDSSAFTWSDQYKAWKTTNQEKAKVVSNTTLDNLKKAFVSAYVSENGALPQDFNIVDRRTEERKFGRNVVRRNIVEGEGISRESASILSNMMKVFKFNPELMDEVAQANGLDKITPQEAVKLTVLGGSQPQLYSLDDIRLMVSNGQLTQDDVNYMMGNEKVVDEAGEPVSPDSLSGGTSTQEEAESPTEASPETFDALRDSTQSEIKKFQKALRQASTPSEKAEVHAAFVDGAFREAE